MKKSISSTSSFLVTGLKIRVWLERYGFSSMMQVQILKQTHSNLSVICPFKLIEMPDRKNEVLTDKKKTTHEYSQAPKGHIHLVHY